MKTVLIAGAGQLGSRHLQGVKTSKYELDIWIFDVSEESLKVAEERYKQVESDNKIAHFVTSLENVPSNIDIVIVASSSKPRAVIIKQILSLKTVKYMVLEKFLFTRVAEYDEIAQLIEKKQVKTWVNCPRRMWDGYVLIDKLINKSLPVIMEYKDSNWGLCCNTVHYLDIFMKLSGESIYALNIDGLVPEVVDSKRQGYVELNGSEVFAKDNGSKLTLTCAIEDVENPIVKINNGETRITYNEGTGKISINGEVHLVKVHYQSVLSGILVDELFETGNCRLSSYEESSEYHVGYLKGIAPFINKIKGWTSDSCPIT